METCGKFWKLAEICENLRKPEENCGILKDLAETSGYLQKLKKTFENLLELVGDLVGSCMNVQELVRNLWKLVGVYLRGTTENHNELQEVVKLKYYGEKWLHLCTVTSHCGVPHDSQCPKP